MIIVRPYILSLGSRLEKQRPICSTMLNLWLEKQFNENNQACRTLYGCTYIASQEVQNSGFAGVVSVILIMALSYELSQNAIILADR